MKKQSDNRRLALELTDDDSKTAARLACGLADVADVLDGKEWNPDMLDAIADIVRREGFTINEPVLEDLYRSVELPDPIPVGLRFVETSDHFWSGPKGRKRVHGVEKITARCRVTTVRDGGIDYVMEEILDVVNPMPNGVYADGSWKKNPKPDDAMRGGMTIAYFRERIAKDEIQVIQLSDSEMCDYVADALIALGFEGTESINTGGGCYCVYIPEPKLPNATWLVGVQAEMWGGCLEDKGEGCPYGGSDELIALDTEVSTDCPDEQQVATAIAKAITEWRATPIK